MTDNNLDLSSFSLEELDAIIDCLLMVLAGIRRAEGAPTSPMSDDAAAVADEVDQWLGGRP